MVARLCDNPVPPRAQRQRTAVDPSQILESNPRKNVRGQAGHIQGGCVRTATPSGPLPARPPGPALTLLAAVASASGRPERGRRRPWLLRVSLRAVVTANASRALSSRPLGRLPAHFARSRPKRQSSVAQGRFPTSQNLSNHL